MKKHKHDYEIISTNIRCLAEGFEVKEQIKTCTLCQKTIEETLINGEIACRRNIKVKKEGKS